MQSDRVDKSAVKSYEEQSERIGTNYKPTKPDSKLIIMTRIEIGQFTNAVFFTVPAKNAANLKARFENIAKNNDDTSRQRVEEERRQRQLKDKQDKEQTEKLEAQRYSFEFEKISFVMAHKNCFNQAQEAEFYEIYRKSLVTILIKKPCFAFWLSGYRYLSSLHTWIN